MSRPIALVLATLILAMTATTALAKDYTGTALNIIPSGEYGSVPAPAGADDQAQMYAGLTPLYDQVGPDDLTKYFKSAKLTSADSCPCRTESVPRKGVRIVRDRFNVPHVTAPDRDGLTWANGWVFAEDRALVLAVGRYPAYLAAVDAPNTTAFSLVTAAKPVAPSMQARREIDKQTRVLRRSPDGRALLHDIGLYVDGVNARLRHDKSKEKPFTRVDVYAITALIGQIFGQGGGDEPRRAQLLASLQQHLGADKGKALFDDFSEHADEEAPATGDKRHPYLDIPKNATGNVVPDAGSYKPVISGNELAGQPRGSAAAATASAPHASNFLLVGAKRSATGHPLFVGGPQIGYFYPGLTFEMDMRAPGIQARGAMAPGFAGNVLIGRGQDNAWTLTSAGSDNIDHYIETLCGSSSTRYRYKGSCRTMGRFNGGKVDGKALTWRTTVHGPVVGYATVNGRKVAVSRKRSSYGQDILFQVPFRDMTLNRVHGVKDFVKSYAKSPYTFNVGYADDRDIAFYSAGKLPIRDKRVDPRLPTNGTGAYEWKGMLKASQHAQATGAADSTLVNWNNQPSRGWRAADNQWGYGPVHRVQMLDAGLARQDKHTAASVVAAMNRAATTDLRAEQLAPVLQDVLRTGAAPTPREDRMLQLIDEWRAAGPSWTDRDGDGKIDSPAAAILERLYPHLYDAILGPAVGQDLPLLKAITGENNSTRGDFNSGGIGYLQKDLRTVLGRPVKTPYSTRFCGGGNLDACRAALWEAFRVTGDELTAEQGTADPALWRVDQPMITFAPLAAFKIPYTNRPSGIQQVLEFTGHRPAAT
jgi:acyl-homoserine lactone acylase PvdQ